MLNEFDFPEGSALLRRTLPIGKRIAALKRRMKRRGAPVIYANDNFGRWKSDRQEVVRRCLHENCAGAPLARELLPDEDDYFVLKPKHSAFFSTTLETLLADLGVDHLVLTGIAANICVYHTALDAHVRDLRLTVPRDCVASNTVAENRWTLRQLARVLGADTRSSSTR